MGALMRAFDWSSTPLGPPEQWSLALQMMVRMLLANSFPILLWWGPDFIQLYNDAYIPVLGKKHPHAALGKPFRECWSEVYHILGPLAETPYRGGPPTWMEDIPLELYRHGYAEEAHFTISYSPVPDVTAPGGTGGVVAIVHETSTKIVADRRILALRDLGALSAELQQAEDVCATAARILSSYDKDVPFCLLYLTDENGEFAHLAGEAGLKDCPDICPPVIDLHDDSARWPLAVCVRTEATTVVQDLARRFITVPHGPWADPPASAAVVPIKSTKAHRLAGFLIAGISSRLKFDDAYGTFLDLASAQISIVIANARTYEIERKRNEALAEIDRVKTVFFSNISHELRTPLTLILGPLEDILAHQDSFEQSHHARLELMHRNALRLLKLVNALLDFSRIEAGRIEASFEPVDLGQLVGDLTSVFRSIVERGGLKLVVECEPLPSPVYVDRGMFEKIVFNLLSNAFKFTFQGEIAVSLRETSDGVELAVSDTGTGIPAEEIPELFRRFHRVRGARSRSYEGSGIGLALVQELVRLHGGSIRIESELNRGSRFIVDLPFGSAHLPAASVRSGSDTGENSHVSESHLHEAERWLANEPAEDMFEGAAAKRDSEPAKPESEKQLLLVADDNADMRDYVSRILEHRYRVETARDGAEAIEIFERLQPDLVLTDIMMPGLDGFAVLHAVRGDAERGATPVILVSARAGEESRVEGVLAGADDYLVKPFSARELMARVESHLALARLRRESNLEIRQSEERFRAFVAASSDVIYQMSPDWKTMRHLEGREFIPSTDSPDQSWMERYIPREEHALVNTAIEHAIQNKVTFQLKHRVFRTDGSTGWTSSRAIPLLDSNGEILEWFGAAADITAQKQSEEALLQSERLASIGRMAATISHEINNPLEALSNLLYLAATSDNVPPDVSHRLEQADAELQRVAHITRQALGFYRENTSPAPASLNALVSSTVDLLKGKIDVKKIKVEQQRDTEYVVTGVAGELRQVFSNLLANSIDAVEDGGRITIRLSPCRMRDNRPGVMVTFADDGKGIDATSKDRVFEPLYTTKGAVGTGLGLWVSRQIVDKHGGTLKMRSAVHGDRRGTVFSVLLPA